MDLLSDFEARLRSQGLPVDEWAKPGLAAGKIEEMLAPLGLRLPTEGLTWWQWHDGANRQGQERLFGPWKAYLSLDEAIAVYQESRSVAEVTAGAWPQNDPDFLWHPTWLPIKGPQLPIVIDCSVPEGQPTPVIFVDWQNVDGFSKPRAESFGQMVSWWIEAIDCGAWRWDPERNQWDTHDELLRWELRTNPLV
jgi:cell wall assembly regulator SMI1